MKARSLVFDLFGDHLRYRGGEVRLRGLAALMGCFGVPEATVRVVVTRLRNEGWLTARRVGRETVYALTPAAWQLLDEGRARIFDRSAAPWDGTWHMVIYSVPETDRALREKLRKKLAWLGFGPLSSGVWVSPHDRVAPLRAAFAGEPARLDTFRSRAAGPDADREMAARCWDLAALDRDYYLLLDRWGPRLAAYRSGAVTGIPALVERVHLVQDFRRFPFRDPDLPVELLPAGWSGGVAHELFTDAHELLRAPAEACADELVRSDRVPDGVGEETPV